MLIKTSVLTKKYGHQVALDHVDFEIAKGQFVAYLGTNGAGKTTTINILTGLMQPTSGTITYAKDLKIGVVFQKSILDDDLSVKDNLYLRAAMYKDVSKSWLQQLIGLLNLGQLLKRKYRTLSGGQKRRVDIARALLNQPDLLFLDEPTTGLDLQTRLVIWELLVNLQKQQGLTIFVTTHYLEEAKNADMMYILSEGKILVKGSADEIKTMYAPTKLVLEVAEPKKLVGLEDTFVNQAGQVELTGLNAQQVITFLAQNQTRIKNFEYRQGSIDEAFIKITGKDLG